MTMAEFTTMLRRNRQRRNIKLLNRHIASLGRIGKREIIRESKRIARNAARQQLRRLISY